MNFTRILIAVMVFTSLMASLSVRAQFVPYSLYDRSALLTNPARASLTDYTEINVHYRHSRVANYSIPSISFMHPFYRKTNGMRYGGVGATLIHQEAGTGGLYKITGATGVFAYTIHLSRHHQIGAGLGGGIINKRVDVSGITTDSQFSFGAYDPSLDNGETIQSNSVTQAVINAGFNWVFTDQEDREKISLGVAAYNVNRPTFDLLENASAQPITYIVNGKWRVWENQSVALSPTFRYVYDGSSGVANIGAWADFTPMGATDVLSAALWYKTTGAVVGAAQYTHSNYVLAASIDLSSGTGFDANINNAYEISLGWRINRKEKIDQRRSTATATTPVVPAPQQPTPVEEPVKEAPVHTTPEQPQQPAEPKEAIAQEEPKEQEAPEAPATPALTKEEEQLANVQINFTLGSDEVSAEEKAFLDNLAATIKTHPDYTLKVTGHTCNIGGKAVNQKVSYERANAVAQQLIARGVAKEQLQVIGMDYQQPIASNDTEAGKQKNRRVTFEWIKK